VAVLGGRDWAGLAREGGVIAAGGLLACGWGALRHGASAQARTMTFGGLVTAQLLHALACRPDAAHAVGRSGARPPNTALAGALAASAAIQGAAFLVPGVRSFLRVAPIGPLDAAVTLGAGLLPSVANWALGPPSSLARARPDRGPSLAALPALPGPAAPAADRDLDATGRATTERLATDRTRGGLKGCPPEGEDDAMRREMGIQIHSYRGHRIEVRDDGGDGWAVAVHPRPGDHGAPETLRSGMPNGLAGLLAEARRQVDRRLDAGPGGVRA
jgi:hypothetical protein